jgi:hypothetical protein
MAVKIGHASSSETGQITGGKAGDQTGREVFTRNWYKHSKGWRVFRPKDPAAAEKIARCMEIACKNNKIGYDQAQRNTLYKAAKPYDFDVSKVTKAVETDCSAMVRVCCAYAGIMLSDFNTSSEPTRLLNSGKFTELTGNKYTASDKYLRRGDILCTKVKGHTLAILTNGSKAEAVEAPPEDCKLGERILQNDCEGADVKELQTYLIQLGYSCGTWGADGDFGDTTELALEEFQKDHGLSVDGVYGAKTHAALMKALDDADKPIKDARKVKIINGNCNIRTAPNTSGKKLGVAKRGETFNYGGIESDDGWHLIEFKNQNGWVSGKYSKLVE